MEFNKNQKDVIKYGKGPLLVEAGPGSGKTTVIVERIKKLLEKDDVDSESFLVITFTTKAADNLKNKLKEHISKKDLDKMQISTIHSFCIEYLKTKNQSLRLLDDDNSEKKALFIQKFMDELGFKEEYTVHANHYSPIMEKFQEYASFKVDDEGLIDYIENNKPISQEYRDFVHSLNYFSKKRVLDNNFKEDWYNARYLQTARAYSKYLELQKDQNYVDFSTLQKRTLEELEKDPETKYKSVLIDEFQDTDPLQFRIFKILQEQSDYFTAVGDVDQHIYAFRSSYGDYFEKMKDACDAHVISLDVNYRSTNDIVNVTDSFIKHQRKEYSKKHLQSYNTRYDNDTFLIRNDDNTSEAKKIFKIIKNLKESGKILDYGEVAVLYRKHSNKTVSELIRLFQENGIDFVIRGQRDLEKQDEVKSIKTLLWYITRKTYRGHVLSSNEFEESNIKAFCGEYFEPAFWSLSEDTKEYIYELEDAFEKEVIRIENEIRSNRGDSRVRAFGRVRTNEDQDTLIEIFNRVDIPVIDLSKISNESDRKFFEKLEDLRERIVLDEPPTILEVYYELLSLGDYFDDVKANAGKVKNLAKLSQTMHNYETFISKTDVNGLLYFLSSIIRKYESDYSYETGVQMMTIHSAKGLEFPVTIIPSLEKGKFPGTVYDPERKKNVVHGSDTYYTPNEFLEYKEITLEEENEYELEEEERIIYVAMTRAADLLILSSIGELPESIDDIKHLLKEFSFEALENVTIENHYTNQEEEKLKLNYSAYSTYMLCPYMYNLIYGLGFKVSDEDVTNLGSVFHEIMEEINNKLKNGTKVDEDKLAEITDEVYERFFNIKETPEEYGKLKASVKKYYNDYSVNVDVLESELPFEIEKENFILNGAIDLVYNIGDGEIGILDYKNSFVTDDKVKKYTPQILTYAAALRELPGYEDMEIKEAVIHFVKSDCKKPIEVSDELIDKQLDNLNQVSQKIIDEKFPKNHTGFCSECKFKTICGG